MDIGWIVQRAGGGWGGGRVNILDGIFYGYWMDSREGRDKNNTPPE